MNLTIPHQQSYSRGELLLRFFLGWLYIGIPHILSLYFMSLISAIMWMSSFFAILFTGRFPKTLFDFQVGILRWQMRLSARFLNLVDGYPPFGFEPQTDVVTLDVVYPQQLSRLLVLTKVFLGWLYVIIPHGIILFLRIIVGFFIWIASFFVILFTGSFPQSWHDFVVGTLRWQTRVNLYFYFMTDEYPPFSSK